MHPLSLDIARGMAKTAAGDTGSANMRD